MLNLLHFWWLWLQSQWGIRHVLTVWTAVRLIVGLPSAHLKLEEKIIGLVSIGFIVPFAWTLWNWFPQIAMWSGCVALAILGTLGVYSTLQTLKARIEGEPLSDTDDADEA